MNQYIELKIKQTLRERFVHNGQDISLGSRFEDDLDIDSLNKVELIMIIEDEFDIDISEEDEKNIFVFQDLIELVEKKVNV